MTDGRLDTTPRSTQVHHEGKAMNVPSSIVAPPTTTLAPARSGATGVTLPTVRVNVMRVGYLVMAVGIALTRWPMLPEAASLPVYEGVVTAILTALSLLAIVGLRYPVRMLPILVFETAWKLTWLAAVALPHLIAGDMDADMSRVLFNVSLVVIFLVVTPWDLVWRRYVRAPGDAWR